MAIKGNGATEETALTGFSGNSQARMAGASTEIWFWELDCDGTAGVGWELEAGLFAQQAIWLQQSAHLPIAEFTQLADNETGAGAICIHTSTTLNKMVVNSFTRKD